MSALDGIGCGDHSCVVRRPRGMGTNGGCRCLPRELHPDDAVRLRKAFHALRAHIEAEPARIAAAVEREREECAHVCELTAVTAPRGATMTAEACADAIRARV